MSTERDPARRRCSSGSEQTTSTSRNGTPARTAASHQASRVTRHGQRVDRLGDHGVPLPQLLLGEGVPHDIAHLAASSRASVVLPVAGSPPRTISRPLLGALAAPPNAEWPVLVSLPRR